jgi:amino acid permease
MIFSLWGASIIPELKEMASKNERRKTLKRTILFGIIIAVLTYIIFIVSVLGVSGKNTSTDAISGLFSMGSGIVQISAIFGFLCCFTSFITIGLTLKKSLEYDFKIPSFYSWIITISAPFVLYFLGAKDFIKIIGFAGGVAIGFEALLIILIYRACFGKKISLSSKIFSYILIVVFGLGILLEVGYFLV